MAVSTSAKLPPAVERFLRLYAEIAKELAKRRAGVQKNDISRLTEIDAAHLLCYTMAAGKNAQRIRICPKM
jgi:hypothetical protein